MSIADDIRYEADLTAAKRDLDYALGTLIATANEWYEKLCVAESIPAMTDKLISRIREKVPYAGTYDRYVEWNWDTKYASSKEFGHPNIQVCRFAETLMVEALTEAGFEVTHGYSGHRHARINADGDTIGPDGGSYGGIKVTW